MKKGDFIFLFLGLFVTIFSGWIVFGSSGPQSRVEIQTDQGRFVYPLDQNREVKVQGPLGTTIIHIEKSKIFIQSSPCANQLCLLMGKNSPWVACLPNHVFVYIQGKTPYPQELDTHAY